LFFGILDKEIFGQSVINGVISVNLSFLGWMKIMDGLSKVVVLLRLNNLWWLLFDIVLSLGFFVF
jgi:hypothetical protein